MVMRWITGTKIIENRSGVDEDEARRLALPFSLLDVPFNQAILFSALVGGNQADSRPTKPLPDGETQDPSYAFLKDYRGQEAERAFPEIEGLGFKVAKLD